MASAPSTSDDFNALATRIYGTTRFQTVLARDIARNRETVNRWSRGRESPPAPVMRWLREHQDRYPTGTGLLSEAGEARPRNE